MDGKDAEGQMNELLQKSVEVDLNRRGGRPVLKGTRVTISQILSQLAEGDSVQDLIDNLDLDGEVIRDFLNGLSIVYDVASRPKAVRTTASNESPLSVLTNPLP